jgi:hypothetical protein
MDAPVEEWARLYAVDREIAVGAAVCRWVNDAMEAGDMDALDRALSTVNMSSIGPAASLGLAVWCSPVRARLRARDMYIVRLTEYLRGEVGRERAWSLMRFAREEGKP